MKKVLNTIITIVLLMALYYGYDKLFDFYGQKTIVFAFIIIVMLTILFFSLRLCFVKKDDENNTK